MANGRSIKWHKSVFVFQGFIIAAGVFFLILAVILKLPAQNDESIVGLKGIMFMILFVINTSSHSLYSSEFYYINNKCGDDCKVSVSVERDRETSSDKNKKKSVRNIFIFNIFILNSAYFLIFSIFVNIVQAMDVFAFGRALRILSFYSFLIFLVVICINYLLYNFLLYSSLRKISESAE